MSTIKANTLLHSDGSTTTQPSIPALDKRMAKAWVNFNGTGTVAIRDSYNVSSITDNGVGSYLMNYTNAMASANYSAMVSSIAGNAASPDTGTTTYVICSNRNASNVATDVAYIQALVFSN